MYNGEGFAGAGAGAGDGKGAVPTEMNHLVTDNQLLRENANLKKELAEAKDELKRLKEILADKEEHKKMLEQDAEFHTRYWLPEEHQRFLTGLKMYGHKDIKSIARFVGTRNATQVKPCASPTKHLYLCAVMYSCCALVQQSSYGARSLLALGRQHDSSQHWASLFACPQVRTHAQKYFMKLEKNGKSLGEMGLPDRPDVCNVSARFVCYNVFPCSSCDS